MSFNLIFITIIVLILSSCNTVKKEENKKSSFVKEKTSSLSSNPLQGRSITNNTSWNSFSYFFDEDKYQTGIRFFDEKNRVIGIYNDSENLKMLNSDKDQKEIGESYKIVQSNKSPKVLITIWLSGQYHRYRVFNPSISVSNPICEFQGEGDYPEKIDYKIDSKILAITVQETLKKTNIKKCVYIGKQ